MCVGSKYDNSNNIYMSNVWIAQIITSDLEPEIRKLASEYSLSAHIGKKTIFPISYVDCKYPRQNIISKHNIYHNYDKYIKPITEETTGE